MFLIMCEIIMAFCSVYTYISTLMGLIAEIRHRVFFCWHQLSAFLSHHRYSLRRAQDRRISKFTILAKCLQLRDVFCCRNL